MPIANVRWYSIWILDVTRAVGQLVPFFFSQPTKCNYHYCSRILLILLHLYSRIFVQSTMWYIWLLSPKLTKQCASTQENYAWVLYLSGIPTIMIEFSLPTILANLVPAQVFRSTYPRSTPMPFSGCILCSVQVPMKLCSMIHFAVNFEVGSITRYCSQ